MTTAFLTHARLATKHLHIERLPLLVTPHPLNDLDGDELLALARACYPVILEQLTGSGEPAREGYVKFEHPRRRKESP